MQNAWQFTDGSLQWRHNERNGVSNHQPHDCLLRCLFRHRSKKISKLHVTGLCEGNSPVTGEFPAQRNSNAENISIWWRHHVYTAFGLITKQPLSPPHHHSSFFWVSNKMPIASIFKRFDFHCESTTPYQRWLLAASAFTGCSLCYHFLSNFPPSGQTNLSQYILTPSSKIHSYALVSLSTECTIKSVIIFCAYYVAMIQLLSPNRFVFFRKYTW